MLSEEDKKLKRAEKSLGIERNALQKYFDFAGVMLVAIDVDQNVTIVNKKTCEVLEYEAKEIISKNWFENFLPERERETTRIVFEKLISNEIEPAEYFENAVLTKSGQERLIKWHNNVLRDADGTILEVFGAGENITERRKAEEALKASEEKYRTLVESSSDAIFMMDKDRIIVSCNQAFFNLFGFDRNEVEGKSVRIIHPSLDSFISFGNLAYPIIDKKGFLRTEWNLMKKDGTVFQVETVISAIKTNDQSITGYVNIVRDITERKKAEEALRDSENHVRALNKEILNMLMVISHDLRSPLISIGATFKLLTRGIYGHLDTSVKNTLIELHGRIERLLGVAEDCLGKVSGIEGEVHFVKKMLDLREDIIDAVLNEFLGEMEKQNIIMDNRLGAIPAKRIPVKADKVWLKVVFRNLFSNAIKYGGRGCSIAFGFEDCEQYYKFNVYNSGAPVPEGLREKLFTKFHRDEGVGVTSMGLGLYLTKQIIQQHGGDIWYEPKEWGSNFVLTLPHD